jgi:hypothetical protein
MLITMVANTRISGYLLTTQYIFLNLERLGSMAAPFLRHTGTKMDG